jgi:hypothetical protein
MANAPVQNYSNQVVNVPAGQTLSIPGVYTWIEFLEEYETAHTDVPSNAIQIRLYQNDPPQALPTGFTVILEKGQPSNQLALVNTDQVNDVTVVIAKGASSPPGVDHRLTLPVGTSIDVVVTNTSGDPVPVDVLNEPIVNTPVPDNGSTVTTSVKPLNLVDHDFASTPFGTTANTGGTVLVHTAGAKGAIIQHAQVSQPGAAPSILFIGGLAVCHVANGSVWVLANPLYIEPGITIQWNNVDGCIFGSVMDLV